MPDTLIILEAKTDKEGEWKREKKRRRIWDEEKGTVEILGKDTIQGEREILD